MERFWSLSCAALAVYLLRMSFLAWSKKASWQRITREWRKSKRGSKAYWFDVILYAVMGLSTAYGAVLIWIRS